MNTSLLHIHGVSIAWYLMKSAIGTKTFCGWCWRGQFLGFFMKSKVRRMIKWRGMNILYARDAAISPSAPPELLTKVQMTHSVGWRQYVLKQLMKWFWFRDSMTYARVNKQDHLYFRQRLKVNCLVEICSAQCITTTPVTSILHAKITRLYFSGQRYYLPGKKKSVLLALPSHRWVSARKT